MYYAVSGLVAGQLRVRVMDTLYRVELRHQEDLGESLDQEDEESLIGQNSRIWLCVWSGKENLCVNVSRQKGSEGWGELYAHLSHSFQLLKATGNNHLTKNMSLNVQICF